MTDDNGLRERVVQTERRLDQSEEARSRIWERVNRQETQVELLKAELRNTAAAQRERDRITSEKLDAIREEQREVAEGLVARADEQTRLSAMQRVAVVGAVGVVLASFVTAIATLAGAGAFG